jgi:hypothetical protein
MSSSTFLHKWEATRRKERIKETTRQQETTRVMVVVCSAESPLQIRNKTDVPFASPHFFFLKK